MSLLRLWSAINNIGGLLLGGGAEKRRVILSSAGERLVLPVTPSVYDLEEGQKNPIVDILDFGEAQLMGNPKLKRLSFSGFFPLLKHDYPFAVGDAKSPAECVAQMEKWKEGKKPVRVIITDSPVNLMMMIESFTYKEQDGSRDIYYTLKFVEWKDLNTPLANNDKEVEKDTGLKKRPAAAERPSSMERARDALEASRRAYGDFTRWRGILRGGNAGAILHEVKRRTGGKQ